MNCVVSKASDVSDHAVRCLCKVFSQGYRTAGKLQAQAAVRTLALGEDRVAVQQLVTILVQTSLILILILSSIEHSMVLVCFCAAMGM